MKRSILLLTIICILSSCNTVQKQQKEWIMNNMANFIWIDIAYDALEESATSVQEYLIEAGNEAISEYSDRGYQDDLNTMISAELLGLSALYNLSGGSSAAEKKRDKAIDNYVTHSDYVIEYLGESILDCLSYRDSSHLSIRDMITKRDLFDRLLGTPDNIPQIDDEDIEQAALWVAIYTLQDMQKPVIASCDYDKDKAVWYVRMDNADNQYVKFYARTDGEYDVEYGSKLGQDGKPETDESFTTSFFSKTNSYPVQVLQSNVVFNVFKKPTKDMLYGSWYSKNANDPLVLISITKEGARYGYDIAKLDASGQTGYKDWAQKIVEGIAYSREVLNVEIEDDTINLLDPIDDILSQSLYLDESKQIILDKNDMTTLYYKVK